MLNEKDIINRVGHEASRMDPKYYQVVNTNFPRFGNIPCDHYKN